MKIDIKLEQELDRDEIEVLIKYAEMNGSVRQIETFLRSLQKTIKCSLEQAEVWVNAADIYYVESVDKRTFVYGADTVYRSELRLYQVLEELSDYGFVQISKSCILNIHALESIKPLFNSRMEARLLNGERVNVTRKYVADIKEKLLEDRLYEK